MTERPIRTAEEIARKLRVRSGMEKSYGEDDRIFYRQAADLIEQLTTPQASAGMRGEDKEVAKFVAKMRTRAKNTDVIGMKATSATWTEAADMVERMQARLTAAHSRGAAEMRERAAAVCVDWQNTWAALAPQYATDAVADIRDAIRQLPLSEEGP